MFANNWDSRLESSHLTLHLIYSIVTKVLCNVKEKYTEFVFIRYIRKAVTARESESYEISSTFYV